MICLSYVSYLFLIVLALKLNKSLCLPSDVYERSCIADSVDPDQTAPQQKQLVCIYIVYSSDCMKIIGKYDTLSNNFLSNHDLSV